MAIPRWGRVAGGGPPGVAALLAAVVLIVTACGSSGSKVSSSESSLGSSSSTGGASTSTASCVAKASAFVAPYLQLPTVLASSVTPLTHRPAAHGLIIRLVASDLPPEIPLAAELNRAAAAIGWTGKTIDFDGSVAGLNTAFQQAFADKPTAIVESGEPKSTILGPIAEAKKAGVVIEIDGSATGPVSYPGFAAVNGGPTLYQLYGRIQANLFMKASGCTGHVGIVDIPYPVENIATKSFRATVAANCPDCKVSYNEIQASDLGTPAGTTAIVSFLQQDSSIKYLFAVIGDVADGLTAALNQANITGVHIFGNIPTSADIKGLQDNTEAWWIEQNSLTQAWEELNSVLQAIDQKKPVETSTISIPILTPQNVPKGSTAIPVYPAAYQVQLLKLWKEG